MNKIPLFLSLLLCSCTVQNQLILDPFYEGESLMIRDEAAIAEFETLMSDIGTPDNEYETPAKTKNFFNSPDAAISLSTIFGMLSSLPSEESIFFCSLGLALR